MLKKSPNQSLCPYYYMGGELHPLKYGSYFNDKTALFNIIDAEEQFILESFGINNSCIWIDLYETALDHKVIKKLSMHLNNINHKIRKLCFVGCSWVNKNKLKNKIKIKNMDLSKQIKFFSDPKLAKQWLVGNR